MARFYGSGGGTEIHDTRIDKQMVQVFRRFPDDVHVLMEFTTPDGRANPDFLVIRENAQCTAILYEVKNIGRRVVHATIEGPWQLEDARGRTIPYGERENPIQQTIRHSEAFRDWLIENFEPLFHQPWSNSIRSELSIYRRLVLPTLPEDSWIPCPRFFKVFESYEEVYQDLRDFRPNYTFTFKADAIARIVQALGLTEKTVVNGVSVRPAPGAQEGERPASPAEQAREFNRAGKAYTRRGDYDQAIEMFEKAIALQPDNPGYYSNLGLAFEEAGYYARAVEAYEKAASLNPRAASYPYYQGRVYEKMGRLRDALERYKAARAIASSYADVQEKVRTLTRKLETLGEEGEARLMLEASPGEMSLQSQLTDLSERVRYLELTVEQARTWAMVVLALILLSCVVSAVGFAALGTMLYAR